MQEVIDSPVCHTAWGMASAPLLTREAANCCRSMLDGTAWQDAIR